jgi:hypothetical protein
MKVKGIDMWKAILAALALMTMLPVQLASAEAIYPPAPEVRPEGLQQGRVGSCMAEAQTSAIENAFRVRGYAVTVSSYHAHAFNWQNDSRESGIYQDYLPEDTQLFKHFGRFVPRYMLPEDGRGFFSNGTVNRPAVSSFGVYDFGFPSVAQTGQSDQYVFFRSAGVAQLKQWVRERRPVTISIQGYLMATYNLETGLLTEKYENRPVVEKDRNLDVDHAVALVGFDDDLVAGEGASPGAFIVRNSWNENEYVYGTSYIYDPKDLNDKDREDFQRMRAKINPTRVDMGYFAIPYQYVSYLASQGAGGARIFDINYRAFYDAYVQFERQYTIRSLPFYCDARSNDYILNTYPRLLGDLRGGDKDKKAKAMTALSAISSRRVVTRPGWAGLRFARVAQTAKADRTLDFYKGHFADYYWERYNPDSGPREHALTRPDFQSALTLLTEDVNGLSTWLATYKSIYNYLGEKNVH